MIMYTYVVVITGVALLGLLAGLMGVFIYLEGDSLLTDAVSHAALPGIALMFLCTQTKNVGALLCGGACTSMLAAWLVYHVNQKTRLKKDATLGTVLSIFFGFGIVVLSLVQKWQYSDQAIVGRFLFGSAATLLLQDLILIAAVASIVLIIIIMFWRDWQLLLFDKIFAHTVGYRVFWWRMCLMGLTVLTILAGLQAVGVMLMSSFFVAPAAIARQITFKFSHMAICSALCGMCAGAIGAGISCIKSQLPTGPVIIILLTSVFICLCLVRIVYRYMRKKLLCR